MRAREIKILFLLLPYERLTSTVKDKGIWFTVDREKLV